MQGGPALPIFVENILDFVYCSLMLGFVEKLREDIHSTVEACPAIIFSKTATYKDGKVSRIQHMSGGEKARRFLQIDDIILRESLSDKMAGVNRFRRVMSANCAETRNNWVAISMSSSFFISSSSSSCFLRRQSRQVIK